MKLTPALLLLTALPALAQTSTAVRPAVHHIPAHPAASPCGLNAQPTLPLTVPRVPGCAKPLYALRAIDTVVGSGASVTPRKWLTVNYTGYLIDGTKFDTSIGTGPDGKPKEPITFPYGAHQVIAGWDTGFEGMNIGGKRRLFIPYELAYGETGRPPIIPAKAELIFDIELLGISDTPPQPKAPPAGQQPGTQQPGNVQPGAQPPAGNQQPTPQNSQTGNGNGRPSSTTIPPTNTPPATPAPPTDPTKPTAIPPTNTPPTTSPKP